MFTVWRVSTLCIGIYVLCLGSVLTPAPDWDYGVSFLMAIITFFTAPFVVTVMVLRKWKQMPLALCAAWFAVDGCYFIYWSIVNEAALVMRDVQWPVSACLFLMMGLIWRKWP